MDDEKNTTALTTGGSSVPAEINITDLNKESKELLNKIIAEADLDKTKDLTYLFNINQNKKTMVRVDKLSELLDTITNQAMARFTARPDEISNQELLQSLKTVSDLIERGQKQVSEPVPQPLIQINQQNNEINVDGAQSGLSGLNRDSREKVKNAVLALLQGIKQPQPADVVDVEEDEECVVVEELADDNLDSTDLVEGESDD